MNFAEYPFAALIRILHPNFSLQRFGVLRVLRAPGETDFADVGRHQRIGLPNIESRVGNRPTARAYLREALVADRLQRRCWINIRLLLTTLFLGFGRRLRGVSTTQRPERHQTQKPFHRAPSLSLASRGCRCPDPRVYAAIAGVLVSRGR